MEREGVGERVEGGGGRIARGKGPHHLVMSAEGPSRPESACV
jgi:hypothetical protein